MYGVGDFKGLLAMWADNGCVHNIAPPSIVHFDIAVRFIEDVFIF